MKIEMAHIERIRWHRLVEQRSQRETAQVLGISRNTVAKYEDQITAPRYARTQPYESLILGPFKSEIEHLLQENQTLPKKQRWIGRTIFEHLQQKGYTGSEPSVRRYIGQARRQARQVVAYVPLSFRPGEAAEFDFGEVEVTLAGQRVTVYMFCYRLRWSHMIAVRLYPTQRQEVLLDGLRWAFEVLGGPPLRVIADNLTPAVQKVLEGHNRKEQEGYLSFRTHYLFESTFCNPGAGWEKGSVENLVGFGQRNIAGPHLEAESWEALNVLVWERCQAYAQRTFRGDQAAVAERWQQERRVLRPLPAIPYECCRTLGVSSNGVSCVRFDTCMYSVPVRHARQPLTLRAYWDRVEVWAGLQQVARHKRCYERDQDVLDLDHYLDLLLQKPGALDQAAPFRAAALPDIYHQFRAELKRRDPRGDREFIRILMLHREFPPEQVAEALAQAHGRRTYQLEAIRQVLFRHHSSRRLEPAPGSHMPVITVQQPSPATYNRLLTGGVVH